MQGLAQKYFSSQKTLNECLNKQFVIQNNKKNTHRQTFISRYQPSKQTQPIRAKKIPENNSLCSGCLSEQLVDFGFARTQEKRRFSHEKQSLFENNKFQRGDTAQTKQTMYGSNNKIENEGQVIVSQFLKSLHKFQPLP